MLLYRYTWRSSDSPGGIILIGKLEKFGAQLDIRMLMMVLSESLYFFTASPVHVHVKWKWWYCFMLGRGLKCG